MMFPGAVYISTEDAFPSKRWKQLASCFTHRYQDLGWSVEKLSDSLYIEHAATIVRFVITITYSSIISFSLILPEQ